MESDKILENIFYFCIVENLEQKMITILFLSADPKNADRLRLDQEAREIREKIQLSRERAEIRFESRLAVRSEDISQALLDVNPDFVHFSGHGTSSGQLCIEDMQGKIHPIEPTALASLLRSFSDQLKCVVLNACFSEHQAKEIVKHIDYVVGMHTEIGDEAALAFSVGFYQGIGANRSIEQSVDLGCAQIQLRGIPEHLTPILLKKPISPSKEDKLSSPIDEHSLPASHTRSLESITPATSNLLVRPEFLQKLQYIEFTKQSRNNIRLDEIFVFPNISKPKDVFEKEIINEDYFIQKKDTSIVIKGDDSSGKTSLLRWLFFKLSAENCPIYIDAETIVKTRNFDPILQDLFQEQYSGLFTDWLKGNDKIALVDNFHHNISSNFLPYLSRHFSMIVICIDNNEWVAYFKDDPSFAKFAILSLGHLSLAKQEELIKLWKKMDFPNQTDLDYLEIDKLEAKVNSVITKNRIVPRYPFYILSILQTLESFMPKDYTITAYGHCYQALVTAQLLKKGINNELIDDCFNFLRELAFDIYKKRINDEEYESSHYRDFKNYYRNKFYIQEALIARLENAEYEILKISNQVRFTHEYIYYFFVGMYFASNDAAKDLERVMNF